MEIKLVSTSAAAPKKVVTFLQSVFGFNAKVAGSVATSLTELSKEKALDSLHIDDFLAFAKSAKQPDIDKAIKSKSIQNMKPVLVSIVKNKTFSGKLAAIKKFKFKAAKTSTVVKNGTSGPEALVREEYLMTLVETRAQLKKAVAEEAKRLGIKATVENIRADSSGLGWLAIISFGSKADKAKYDASYNAGLDEGEQPAAKTAPAPRSETVNKLAVIEGVGIEIENPTVPEEFRMIGPFNHDITNIQRDTGAVVYVVYEDDDPTLMISGSPDKIQSALAYVVSGKPNVSAATTKKVAQIGVKYEATPMNLEREADVILRNGYINVKSQASRGEGAVEIDLNPMIANIPASSRKALFAKIVGEDGFTEDQEVVGIDHAEISNKGIMKVFYVHADEYGLTPNQIKTKLTAALKRWLVANAAKSNSPAKEVYEEYLMTLVETRAELKKAVSAEAKRLGIKAKVMTIRDDESGLGYVAKIAFPSVADKAKYDESYNAGLDD